MPYVVRESSQTLRRWVSLGGCQHLQSDLVQSITQKWSPLGEPTHQSCALLRVGGDVVSRPRWDLGVLGPAQHAREYTVRLDVSDRQGSEVSHGGRRAACSRLPLQPSDVGKGSEIRESITLDLGFTLAAGILGRLSVHGQEDC